MKKSFSIFLLVLIVFAVFSSDNSYVEAEEFPTKPIELWVGYSAGGSTDLNARALADYTSKILRQPIVLINKPGGASSVMLSELKTKKPDGYTIGVFNSGGVVSALMRKVPYHPINDFDPIIHYAVTQFGLVVRADSPWRTFKELIAYSAANPNMVKYATSGVGTAQHLGTIRLAEAAKVKWIHIPYASGPEVVTAVLGGHVDFCPQTTDWKPQVNAGRLRLLAILTDIRMEEYPNVPTLIELGYNIQYEGFAGIAGPHGIPKDRIKILQDAFSKGLQDSAFKNSLKHFDTALVPKNAEEFGKYIKEFYERMGQLVELVQKK